MNGLEGKQVNQIVGENVRKYRIIKGLKQEELAKGLCSISQLSKFETGKTQIKADLLKQLADRLGVTIELLETSDALVVELRERMQVAYQAASVEHYERSLAMIKSVMNEAEELAYLDLWVDGLMMECRLLNAMQKPKCVIQTIERAFSEREIPAIAHINLLVDLARAYEKTGAMKSAYDCYNRADDAFSKIERETDEEDLRLHFRLALSHFQLRNNRTGLQFAERAIVLASEKTKHLWRIRAMDLLANFQFRLGLYEQAKETFLAALKEAQDNSMLLETGNLNNELGAMLLEMEDLVPARLYLQRALQVLDIIREAEALLDCQLNLAELALLEKDFALCEKQLEQTHALIQEAGAHTYLQHARAHHLRGRLQAAQGHVDGLVWHMQMALELYDRNQVVFEAFDTAVELADALYAAEDTRAVEYYRKAIEYKKAAEMYSRK